MIVSEELPGNTKKDFTRKKFVSVEDDLIFYRTGLALFSVFLLGLALIGLTGTNKVLFLDINSFTAKTYPFIWANLTFLGDTMAAAAIMLLFIRKRPDLVWAGIIATIIGTLIVNLSKSFFNIPRPPAIYDSGIIHIIGPSLSAHSFPSGHTVTIFTLTGILLFYFKSFYIRFSLILLAILIGTSRIAVGVHWPADVLAGASVGISTAMIGVYSVRKLGWTRNKTVQLIIGFILIILDIYFLIFYDCKYEQAVYLKYFLASVILIAGTREYYLLLKDH